MRFVHLYFSDDDLSRCIEQTWDKSAAQVSLQDLTFIDDPAISSLLQLWALKLNWQDASDQLALEQVSQLLLGHLLKNYADRRFADLPSRGGLAPFQLQRCQDYIEQNLATHISLQHLANLVDLSPYHFARMFKLSSGQSPHQYLTQRRIARAKLLLTSGDLSLARLAYQLGFSSQAHFSARFKCFTGQSPLAYRRSQRT
ncbi:helix-turn-helix domain-containing protein [Agarivorans sp. Z349TD_8]|uniref:helix-turn-helix domain-containing protein n=1 Tax=Agarivorans sp. Z349TD_8 TaxID=3421434 RepID=UPI003D7E5C5F